MERQYNYNDGNGKRYKEWSLGKILIVYFAVLFLCYLLFGCASYKSIESVSIDSTFIRHSDTVRIESVRTVAETKYVDRWNDRFIKVNALGDTVIDRQKEYIYISDNKSISDSISILKSKVDSLSALKQKTEKEYIEKNLTLLQRIQLATYWYILFFMLAFLLCIVIVAKRQAS